MRLKSIFILLCVCFVLASCGRVSKPEAPSDSFYPHKYIVFPDERGVQNEQN